MSDQKFRLITRADFDGVVCGSLFQELDMIDDVVFAEPGDMQAGRVKVTDRDITTNLPFVDGVHLCFDHHASETKRVQDRPNRIIDPAAPSAARVVYNHFGGKKGFPAISDDLIKAVDQADSADYTEEDILAPDRWAMLNFLVDPRSGLAAFKDFSSTHEQFMLDLMTYCRHSPIDEIMRLPEVEERVRRYQEHEERAEHQIVRCATVHGDLIVLDMRREPMIYATNRFVVYGLYPDIKLSLHVLKDVSSGYVRFALGHSILNRGAKVDAGAVMLEFGGGGHRAAAGALVREAEADSVLDRIVARISKN
ncbi:MAG: exopolyphosphatase [Alphaproteobacteria bacterium]|nr:exopolyphosphatase [Alphaproteobacteria bacterium]MBM3734114.1 exopolyphosphatase [Acidimicrobiia bacterium]MBM3950537.1 exopolyphosphatase [Rhodospirillales bacterium]